MSDVVELANITEIKMRQPESETRPGKHSMENRFTLAVLYTNYDQRDK